MVNVVRSASLALWLFTAPLGADAATVITGMVQTQGGQPLPGLTLLEKGEIHNNRWDRGALVDASGRFRIELAEGGQYGLHVYSSGYIYKPTAVKVETGKTLGADEGQVRTFPVRVADGRIFIALDAVAVAAE